MNSEEICKERRLSLNEAFKRADYLVREIKFHTWDEVIPAVLQMRYAGSHLSDWLATEKSEDFEKAVLHTKRAIFEASRYGIAFYAYAIREFQQMYKGEILPDTITDFSGKMRRVQKSTEFIFVEGNEDDRADACERSFRDLKDVYDELEACQDTLNQRAEEKLKSENREKRKTCQWMIMFFLALASLIVKFLVG